MGKGQAVISDGETGAYCTLGPAYCTLRLAYCTLGLAYCTLGLPYCTLGLAYCKVSNMDVLQVAFFGGSNIRNRGS